MTICETIFPEDSIEDVSGQNEVCMSCGPDHECSNPAKYLIANTFFVCQDCYELYWQEEDEEEASRCPICDEPMATHEWCTP